MSELTIRLYEESQDNIDSLYYQAASEIDRLKAGLEEYKRCAKWEGYKAVCIDRDAAIAKIKELTAFSAKEGYRADKLVDKIENLERQLAEARAENESLFLENRKMLQGMKWDNQIRAEARQEAAREICAEIMGGSFIHDQAPPKMFAKEVVAMIKAKFKLEGF